MTAPNVFLAVYTYRVARAARADAQPDHRLFLDRLVADGSLLAAGPSDREDVGVLVVRAGDRAAAERLLADDPYARAGHLASVDLHGWHPRVGTAAAALSADDEGNPHG